MREGQGSSVAPTVCTKISGLWKFAANINTRGNPSRNEKETPVWRYAPCALVEKRQEYIHAGGNVYFRKHLEKIHGIVMPKTFIIGPEFSQTLINMS